MSLSDLPLSYCTNVHPGRTVMEVLNGLAEYTVPARREFGHSLAAGLWLSQPVVRELLTQVDGVRRFADEMDQLDLTCHTLNAFPYGDFHGTRVKEQVYLPDWTQPSRLEYTENCAQILAQLLPPGVDGSISTVPLGFKGFEHPPEFLDRCCGELLLLAQSLEHLYQMTERRVRLAIEPEPFCELETIPEAVHFFRHLRQRAEMLGIRELADEYLGLCFDVCHQAVEYEDIPSCFRQLAEAEIRIHKLHITCAIQLDNPQTNIAGREALARYAEPRYLHQTIASAKSNAHPRWMDLTPELALHPPAEFLNAESWRIHFHVPVNADHLGPLGTTRPQLKQALEEVKQLPYAPHLEVETYTWEVLPDAPAVASSPERLIQGLAQELRATRELILGSRYHGET